MRSDRIGDHVVDPSRERHDFVPFADEAGLADFEAKPSVLRKTEHWNEWRPEAERESGGCRRRPRVPAEERNERALPRLDGLIGQNNDWSCVPQGAHHRAGGDAAMNDIHAAVARALQAALEQSVVERSRHHEEAGIEARERRNCRLPASEVGAECHDSATRGDRAIETLLPHDVDPVRELESRTIEMPDEVGELRAEMLPAGAGDRSTLTVVEIGKRCLEVVEGEAGPATNRGPGEHAEGFSEATTG